MLTFALKSVRHNPKRLLLTAIAVALGVMLVSTTQTLTAALSNGFTGLFDDIYGGSDIVVEAEPSDSDEEQDFTSGDFIFTSDDIETIETVDGVAEAAGTIQVDSAAILAADADPTDPLAQFGPPTQLLSWTGDEKFDRSTLEEGSAPSSDDEIVMDFDSVENLGYAIGDTISVLSASGATPFELVGTVRFGDGRKGRIPPAGSKNVKAKSYRIGGGADGNLTAGAGAPTLDGLGGVGGGARGPGGAPGTGARGAWRRVTGSTRPVSVMSR